MRGHFLAVLLLLGCPAAARAEWFEASSQNFVIYADDSEADIRTLSEQLERYHSAMEFISTQNIPSPSPSSRVTVFIVKNGSEVRRLLGEDDRYANGFYLPRAGSSIAIIPRVNPGKGELDFSMITLLHEYAHHFLMSNQDYAAPRWVAEGAAEFFSSAQFLKDGAVRLGLAALHRGPELFYSRDVSVEALLDPAVYERQKTASYDAYYGKSWLLYHYLVRGGKRDGQLSAYLAAMFAGKTSREAGLDVFGPFSELDQELDKYLNQRRISALRIPPEMLKTRAISLRKLPAGEVAIMPVRIRSRRGVTPEQAAELVQTARQIAAKFPNEAAVMTALAEAEYDAGNDEAAINAANAAIAADPNQPNAYVQKGYALFRMARDAEDKNAAYKSALQPFLALNRIENDHPIPLMYYYRAQIELGLKPSELAVDGLKRAIELAPFDLSLKMTLVAQLINDGQFDLAKKHLGPVAYNPHGGELAEMARKMINQIDSKQFAEVKSSLSEMRADAKTTAED